MANFNRQNRSGGNRNFGKPRFSSDRQDMHKATCATCGKICEVPFKPTGTKPVYCKECFQKNKGFDSRRNENRSFYSEDSRNRTGGGPDYTAQLEALNAKMDKILNLLTPTPTKAVQLESAIDESVIDEIAETVQEEKIETTEKKPKKVKSLTKKSTTATKKAPAAKKK